jgi:uncharacterized protein (DUF983 family)
MSRNNLWPGLGRGFVGHCPNCGKGALFRAYLKVASPCAACGHDNAQYPSDDAPPYFTILIVGHLVVPPLVLFPVLWTYSPLLVLAIALPLVAILTLVLLPRIKGAVIGLQWAIKRNEGDVPGQEDHPGWAPTPPEA